MAIEAGGTATESRGDGFRALCAQVEPGLRRALVAAYGLEVGSEAAADALAWAWEHLERVEGMVNPGGYLWRVGQTSARRNQPVVWPGLAGDHAGETAEPPFEPGLRHALAGLTEKQRASVLLVHGYGFSLSEAADQLGCRIRTLRNHLDRGMAKVRRELGVTDEQ